MIVFPLPLPSLPVRLRAAGTVTVFKDAVGVFVFECHNISLLYAQPIKPPQRLFYNPAAVILLLSLSICR